MIKLIKNYMKERQEKINFQQNYPCYRDGDIKCPNFEICGKYDFPLNMNCHGGLCFNCDVMFGKLDGGKGKLIFMDNFDCCICLENKRCVSMPKCNHFVCIDDFKRLSYGEKRQNEPPFPYPELEDDYDGRNHNNNKYDDDPVIIKYNEDHNKWDDAYDEKYENEENLRNCPLCRN
jgi:hypothetical protein